MNFQELWLHDRQPHFALATGERVYVEAWRMIAEMQSRGIGFSVAADDGQLHVTSAERLKDYEASWLEDNEVVVCMIVDDEARRSTLQ